MATYCCYYFSAHKAWLWPCCLCRSFRRFGLKLHQRWDSASREKAAADLFLGSHGLCAEHLPDLPGQGQENIQQLVSLADPLLHPFLNRCLEVIEKANILAVPSSWGWTALRLHAVGIPWIISSRAFPGLGSVVSRASRILKHCIVICHM